MRKPLHLPQFRDAADNVYRNGLKPLLPSGRIKRNPIFDLVAANEQEPAQGRICRATIGDAPLFVAISHVWGDRSRDRSVRLESGCGTNYAKISTNLETFFTRLIGLESTAFPQLWLKGSRLPLWVDMICINQVDVAEKALQIPLMREIYSLLGLCSSEEVAGNPIRYDLEPEEVHKTFVATHARLYNNLEFLGRCTAAQRDSVCSGSVSRPFAGPS